MDRTNLFHCFTMRSINHTHNTHTQHTTHTTHNTTQHTQECYFNISIEPCLDVEGESGYAFVEEDIVKTHTTKTAHSLISAQSFMAKKNKDKDDSNGNGSGNGNGNGGGAGQAKGKDGAAAAAPTLPSTSNTVVPESAVLRKQQKQTLPPPVTSDSAKKAPQLMTVR